jgi:hypothetical protein
MKEEPEPLELRQTGTQFELSTKKRKKMMYEHMELLIVADISH